MNYNGETIPIFIIVHDRLNVLKKCVNSIINQNSTSEVPIKIIFHDVASTYKPCLEYLEEMKTKGYNVFRTEINHHHTVNDTIQTYLMDNPDCKYYILTDPDIELNNIKTDYIKFYLKLMKEYKDKYIIAPMLKIDDIPNFYPHKQWVFQRHKHKWMKPFMTFKNEDEVYKIKRLKVDTTFQLVPVTYKNKYKYPRSNDCLTCLSPYDAKHLDWYINPKNLTDDQIYYNNNAKKNISHWGVKLF